MDDDARRAVGERIRSARVARGFSQEELAEKVSLRGQTIHRYEKGRLTPSLQALVDLAQVCGVSMEWIATGEGDGPSTTDAGADAA